MVDVHFQREADEEEDGRDLVIAPYYPKAVEENWWVLIGDNKSNKLHVIKRVKIQAQTSVTLTFNVPEPGTYALTLYAICDSYVGCDQGEKFELIIPHKDS